jgi:hypothetical protein
MREVHYNSTLPPELKSWLDRCLVPILVRQYLEEAKATVAVASEDVRDSACEMMTLPDEVKK